MKSAARFICTSTDIMPVILFGIVADEVGAGLCQQEASHERPNKPDLWPAPSNMTNQTKDYRRHLDCFTSSVAATHAQAQTSMDLSGFDLFFFSPLPRISFIFPVGIISKNISDQFLSA